IDQLGDAIFIADADGRVLLANAAARATAGEGVIGRQLPEVIRHHETLAAIASAREGREATATIERAEPRRFLRAFARPLEGGQILVVIQDLTTLRRLETVRSDFVANVSHELRRPISSLKAMAEALEEGALDDPTAARDFVHRMHQEIDGLAQLTNELLALTRIESGAETLMLAPQSPVDLLTACPRRWRARGPGPREPRAQRGEVHPCWWQRPALRGPRRRPCRLQRLGHRRRDRTQGPGSRVRALLQGRQVAIWWRHRAGSRDREAHRAGARRRHRGAERRAGPRDHLPLHTAAGVTGALRRRGSAPRTAGTRRAVRPSRERCR